MTAMSAFLPWFFVAATTLHNLEEAIWLPAWSRRAGRWHAPVGAAEFRFAVLALTLTAALVAGLAQFQGPESIGVYLLAGYALAMLLNVLVPHLGATIAMRRYMPGTATALLFNLPAAAFVVSTAFREGWISTPTFYWAGPAVVLAIMASIPALFSLGRRLTGRGVKSNV
ncbi:MAG: HXXEE domain-containing protein [Phyllobacteriaceae bacterium]|nr:HXXEE domain-containing protein [Phyllobacteriaceae bacterium]